MDKLFYNLNPIDFQPQTGLILIKKKQTAGNKYKGIMLDYTAELVCFVSEFSECSIKLCFLLLIGLQCLFLPPGVAVS